MMPSSEPSLGPPPLRPEAELLLACARLQLDPAQHDRVRHLLTLEMDWLCLLQLAEIHGLRPLLFRQLNAVAANVVPRVVYAELWGRHEQLARHNQGMAKELATILRLLDDHGIPALPYKGPMLALTVYGDLALREFNDLDLLLRPADILRAKELLATLGYQPDYPLGTSVEAAFLRSRANYHMMLVRQQRSMLVELHWKTDAEFQVEPSHDNFWWDALPRTRLGALEVRCFAPRELALVLCLHGSKHYWASLGWLVDVAELIGQQPGLDWDWIIARAGQLRAKRRLAFALVLARKLLKVALPDAVVTWLATQPEAGNLVEAIVGGLFDPTAPRPNAWQRLRLNFRLYDHWHQRLQHAVDVTLKPGLVEWSRWPLPRYLFFLYLPLRVMALLKKHGQSLAHKR